MLLGFPLDCIDAVKGSVDSIAVFYFGDFSSFVIQENSDGLEIEVMREMYMSVKEVGLKLYNLLDGKLIYSEVESLCIAWRLNNNINYKKQLVIYEMSKLFFHVEI